MVEVQHLRHLLLQQNLAREAMKLSSGTAQSRPEHLVAPMLTTLLILNMQLRVSLTSNLRLSLRSTTTTRMEATTTPFSSKRRTIQLILGRLRLKKKRLLSIPQAGIAPPSSTLLPRFPSDLLPPSQFSLPATWLNLQPSELVASNLPNSPKSPLSTKSILECQVVP